jgi:hypothetical protein
MKPMIATKHPTSPIPAGAAFAPVAQPGQSAAEASITQNPEGRKFYHELQITN